MYEVAKKALAELRWDDFFSNLSGVEERYQKEGLLREALKVARFQQDFERIKYIIRHNSILPDDVVRSAIDYLLELGKEDAVLNIAVLSNNQSQQDIAALALSKIFMTRNDFSGVQRMMPYIKDRYSKGSLLDECVKKINVSDQLELWLCFLGQKLAVNSSYSNADMDRNIIPFLMKHPSFSDICRWLGQWPESKAKEYVLEKLYLRLLVWKQLEKCTTLAGILSANLKWLEQLALAFSQYRYIYLIDKLPNREDRESLTEVLVKTHFKEFSRLADDELLLKIISFVVRIPHFNNGREIAVQDRREDFDLSLALLMCEACLAKGRVDVVIDLLFHECLLEDDRQNDVYEVLSVLLDNPLSSEQVSRVLQCIKILCDKHFFGVDNLLIKLLNFELHTDQYDLIFELSLSLLVESKREYLHLRDPYNELLLKIFGRSLTEAQYRRVLPYIDLDNSKGARFGISVEEIWNLLPADLLAEERIRREQGEVAKKIRLEQEGLEQSKNKDQDMRVKFTEFDKLHAINAKSSPHYNSLCQLINYFTQIGEPELALSLCKKMVKARYRDSYLQLIIGSAISCAKYEEAAACVKLFCDKSKNTAISRLIQLVRGGKAQRIFEFLVTSDLLGNFKEQALVSGRKILESAGVIAVPFLINHKVFSFPNGYLGFGSKQLGPIEILQELVMAKLLEEILQLSGNQSLVAYLQKITIDKLGKSFENLIKQLLLRGKLEFAIDIANFYQERRAEPERFLYLSTFENESSIAKLFLQYFSENKMRLTKELLMTLSRLRSSVQVDIVSKLWEQASPSSDEELALLSTMPDGGFKQRKLVEFVVYEIRGSAFLLAKKAARYFPSEEQDFWYQVIHHCELREYDLLWQYLIEAGCNCHELISFTIKQMILEKSADDLLRILLDTQGRLSLLNQQKSADYFSQVFRQQSAASSIYHMTYQACYAQWNKMHLETEDYLALFRGIQALLVNSAAKISLELSFVVQLTAILKNVVRLKYYSILFDALDLLKEQLSSRSYGDDFYSSNVSLVSEVLKIFESLLKAGDVLYAEKLLSYVEKDSYRYAECIFKLVQYYFYQKNYPAVERAFSLLNMRHSTHDLYSKIKDLVVQLIKENEIEQALSWLEKYSFAFGEYAYIYVIDNLIDHDFLVAKQLIERHVTTASSKLELMKKLRTAYFEKIKSYIGDELSKAFLGLYHEALIVLHLLRDPAQESEANNRKNALLIELRNQLDKVFIEFYRGHYGDPPRGVTVYFPVVPDLRGGTVEKELKHYFKTFVRQATFSTDHPSIFRFLLDIQPLHNPAYVWLAQLYKLANMQKHDKTLPLKPFVDGVELEMSSYLPMIIDGVLELFIRLSNPGLPRNQVQALRFSEFMPTEHMLKLTSTSSFFYHPGGPVIEHTLAPVMSLGK